jgi:hypothetical protein
VERMNADQVCEVKNVVQEELKQCCMVFHKSKGRLCTCRYRVDDTDDCLLDMLIRVSLLADAWGYVGIP